MKVNRTLLREKIMTILYQIYIYRKDNIEFNVNDVIKENVEIDNEFVNTIVNGVLEKEEDGNIDQAIFRMSVYELLYYDTPNIVCINEGIELCKKYSDEKVTGLLNSVLDKIYDLEVKDE